MQRTNIVEAWQLAAKGVGHAFTGGRDLNEMLANLHFATLQVDAYFSEKEITDVLPETLCTWAQYLIDEGREMHARVSSRLEGMAHGVRGAAESSLHALSSAAGALTGVAALDIGRQIFDELSDMTNALNDILAKATRLVMLATVYTVRHPEKTIFTAETANPRITQLEINSVHPRLWIQSLGDGIIVGGEPIRVTWRTVGRIPLVNCRLKEAILGLDIGHGKTALRLTSEEGDDNRGEAETLVPYDMPPARYTIVVSDTTNHIRGMSLVTIVRPISVLEISAPSESSALKSLGLGAVVRPPVWQRGSTHTIAWKMSRAKESCVFCTISISTREEGPWLTLEGAACLKFQVPSAAETTGNNNNNNNNNNNSNKEEAGLKEGEQTDQQLVVSGKEKSAKPGFRSLWSWPSSTTASNATTNSSNNVQYPSSIQGSKPGVDFAESVASNGSSAGTNGNVISCAFVWDVPHELRPGRYTIRITPIIHSEIMMERSKDSTHVYIQ